MRSQAAWKRLRPTEPPGKDTVQPVKLPADCAVCSRFPALVGSHPCWDWLWWYSCLSHLFTVTLTYILLSNSNKTQWFAKSDINGICILVYISSPSWVSIGVYVCLPKKKSFTQQYFGWARDFLLVCFYISFSKDNFQKTNKCVFNNMVSK